MASIILSAAGNAALPGIGGMLLGTLGKFAGGLIDQQLGLGGSRHISGPRLENLKVQDSRYGLGIPQIFGRARVAGQVIWASDLQETAQEDNIGGGKGGGGSVSATRYSYSVSCAIALGAGPVAQLAAVWADGKQIYDGTAWKSGLAASISFHRGDTTQLPDAVLEAALGSGAVPAYRGIAYLVFERLQLADFGNRLPNITCEVIANQAAAQPTLGANTEPLLQNVGTGYATSGGTPPLIISGSARNARRVLVAGMQNAVSAGSMARCVAVTYDVQEEQPQEVARQVSAPFTLDAAMAGLCWALSPDGQSVAYLVTSSASPLPQATLLLYDVTRQQFGAPQQLAVKPMPRSLVWLDALHLAFADHDGNALGVQVCLRRGLGFVALGFMPIWGAGSAASRVPLGTAQFLPCAGGVLMLAGPPGTSPTTLYGCWLGWAQNQLVTGVPYIVASAIPANSLNRADILACGEGEFLFVFRRTDRVVLCSFIPSQSSAVLTREWQTMPLSVVSDDTGVVWLGNRLLVLQQSIYEDFYRLSEITLAATDFTLVTDAIAVTGDTGAANGNYQPYALDYNRLLVQGGNPFALDFGELRVLNRYAGGDTLQNITSAILTAAGYAPGDVTLSALGNANVVGYVLQPPMTARAALEPLRRFGHFDLVESGDVLKAVSRQGVLSVTIPTSETRATLDATQLAPAIVTERVPELDLPRRLLIDYLDPAQDFAVGTQQAQRRHGLATAQSKVTLPLVCSAGTAQQLAAQLLFNLWAERDKTSFTLSRRYLMLEPGDVISTQGRTVRLQRVQQSGGLLRCEAVPHYWPARLPSSAVDAPRILATPLPQIVPSQLILFDAPPLAAAANQPGCYAAVTGHAGWSGAVLWRARDGVNFQVQQNFSLPALAGVAVSVLPAAAVEYGDRQSSVEIQLWQGALASCSDSALLQGANTALLGDEIIQFQSATLLDVGHYRLSGLLRGRRGTEAGTATHRRGEDFLLLQTERVNFLPLSLAEKGLSYSYKAASIGQALGDVPARTFASQLRSVQPLAPAHLRGMRMAGAGSDCRISWIRRARLNAEWLDGIDVPLDEAVELYDLEIYDDSGSLKRSMSGLTLASYLYSAVDQMADFGAPPVRFTVKLYQVSALYGRGVAASAII